MRTKRDVCKDIIKSLYYRNLIDFRNVNNEETVLEDLTDLIINDLEGFDLIYKSSVLPEK